MYQKRRNVSFFGKSEKKLKSANGGDTVTLRFTTAIRKEKNKQKIT